MLPLISYCSYVRIYFSPLATDRAVCQHWPQQCTFNKVTIVRISIYRENKRHKPLQVSDNLLNIVDHDVLLSWLGWAVGIRGTALSWFQSYIKITEFHLDVVPLACDVPQGSILAPILFSLCVSLRLYFWKACTLKMLG